jgi:urease accessory protein UreF
MEEVQRLEARVGLIGGSPFYSQGLERYLYAGMLEDAGRLEEAARWYGSFSSNSIFDFVFLAPSHAARGRIRDRLGRRREAAADYGRARELLRDADLQMGSLVRELEQGLRRVKE